MVEALPQTAAAGPRPVVMPPRYKVRVERNVAVPVRDGTKLMADLTRPDQDGRFPAIIEYLPYRKDDLRQGDDTHHYFAERGFVAVRLDARGTGGSEGVNTDEYMPVEQQDGFDAVEWFARQPWCNGNVGMFGSSYGGFTSIQVAMHRPPHLKAIVPMYATDDRYTDDCHYTPGGNMRMYYDVGSYGGNMVAMNALPPYPEYAGPAWAELWKQRLEKNQPYLLNWMKHQVDGPYWRAASLRPDYDRLRCPTFLIAGWRDGYVNTMLRTYTRLQVPKKLLVGPWVHTRPNASVPGPRIDYANEVVRFFAHYLRDEDTGLMKEPAVTVYMQDYARPDRTLDITPGHWRNESDFPAAGTEERTYYLGEGGALAERAGDKPGREFDEYEYRPTVGLSNGFWSAGGITHYLADDQRADEAYSLVYTTPPLEREARLLGWPRVVLHASSSARVATFVAKLADVAPDGSSALIVDGSLNGTRRESLTEPKPMTPGEVYELNVPMQPTGWVLKPGHRLRLAVSSSDFPNLWPTPEKAHNRVYRGGKYASRVILPVVPEARLEPPALLPPAAGKPTVQSYGSPHRQQVLHDQSTGAVTVLNHTSVTMVLQDNLGTLTQTRDFRCTAQANDPAQASIVGTHTYLLRREDGVVEVTAESTIRATATAFHITINLNVTRNGKPFFHKQWMVTEPRRLL
jgi:putative CocE/NonD family hydrolase